MIIQKVEKLKRSLLNFLKVLKKLLFFLCLVHSIFCISQQKNSASKFRLEKISFYYGIGNESNFIFNDKDYSYKIDLVKASLYYPLNKRKYQLGLSIQPQIHFIEHQLLNEFFIQPNESNFQELRDRFTQIKSMRMYALQGELSIKKHLLNKVDVLAFLSFGPAIIDTETERLSKGFTFIENLGLTIDYLITDKWFLSIKPSFNHVSNAKLLERNSGYNSLNLEVGFGFRI